MMTLTIPAGVDNGKRIDIPHQGDAGRNGGQAGDLIVVIHVAEDRFFERSGQDLYCAVPITMAQASLGAEITIPLLDDKRVSVKVPAGTSNGKLLRIKGEGVPYTGTSRRGDLYVKIVVQVPSRLSAQQKALLEQYLALENPTTSPDLIPLESLSR